ELEPVRLLDPVLPESQLVPCLGVPGRDLVVLQRVPMADAAALPERCVSGGADVGVRLGAVADLRIMPGVAAVELLAGDVRPALRVRWMSQACRCPAWLCGVDRGGRAGGRAVSGRHRRGRAAALRWATSCRNGPQGFAVGAALPRDREAVPDCCAREPEPPAS